LSKAFDLANKHPHTPKAKVNHPLRSEKAPEFIAFDLSLEEYSGGFPFNSGPALLISPSGKHYPITLIGFSAFVGGSDPSHMMITTIAHGLEPLEESYMLVQEQPIWEIFSVIFIPFEFLWNPQQLLWFPERPDEKLHLCLSTVKLVIVICLD
jgi:hypothetical protein